MAKRKVQQPVKETKIGKKRIKKAVKKIVVEKAENKPVTITKAIDFSTLNGRFLHVKVGNENRLAKSEEIKEIREDLENVFRSNHVNCIAFVSHHAVNIIVY